LAAQSANGIYVQEADGVTIDSVTVSTDRVNFNSTRTSQSQSLEDLSTTNNGPVKLQSLSGSIVVNPGTAGTNGITANGTGDILLETVRSGMIITNADVQSGSGNITLNSQDALSVVDRLRTGGPGTIYLRSSSGVTVENLEASNNIAIVAGSNLVLGSVNAGSGRVYLEAVGNISDSDPTTNSINVTASELAMRAGGKIGDSDLMNSEDSNRNAIGTQVGTLAALSAKGMYIQEADGVTIDVVSLGVRQVNFNSTQTDRSETLEDLVTTDNGPIKLQSIAGDIIVKSGTSMTFGIQAHSSGDVLLQTLDRGTIITQADVRSGSGDITINSVDALRVTNHFKTSDPGRVYLTSQGDVTVESLDTNNTNLAIVSGRTVELGSIQAGTAKVYLQAARDIIDLDPNTNSINVSASALAMSAGNKIGDSDLNAPVNTNRNAIGTQVGLLAARSATGIYVREADGLTVDTVLVSSSKVNFNSSQKDEIQSVEDLTTTIQGPIKLQSVAGDIQINPGAAGLNGILAAASGDILLQTLDRGTIILNAIVQSEFGDITIDSKDALTIGDQIRIGGPPKLGTIYLASAQDVSIDSLTTNDSNLWVESGANIVLGRIQAGVGSVYLDAQQDILSGTSAPTANVSTRGVLAMRAGSGIGPVITQVDFLAAIAADSIRITELDGVTIKAVTLSVDQVHFNSSKTERVTTLEDLTTTNGGSIGLESIDGDIVVEPGQLPGAGISASGSGNIVLLTSDRGNIILRGDVLSESGDISLGSKDSVLIGAEIKTAGDLVLESVNGAITELDSSAKVQSDRLVLSSGTFAHLHDVTVNRLNATTLTNAVLSSWQELNLQANEQGDDFVDALGTVSQSTKDALRAQYRYAERYQNIGYSIYVVNSKELTVEFAVAGSFAAGQNLSDRPGIYVETRAGDLIVKNAIASNSATDQAGGVVLVSGSKVELGSSAVLQSNYVQNGVIQVQLINDVDLRARIFDALDKPNPAGGLFTTRIVSRNTISESNLPEIPTSPGPTKRILQGVATHFGSANESGFDLYIGYADGKLESFGRQGDLYVRNGADNTPIDAKPQSLSRVGYLERSNPFDGEFLNSVQELPTDVVIRRSDDFFIFQKEQPVGLNNFNPPNSPAATSTGFYDLTVQTHRVPDVISEGSESGLPMPPTPETKIPTFRQPEPYVVRDMVMLTTESPEYEDQPVQERKSRIVVKRIVVSIVEEVSGTERLSNKELESVLDETPTKDGEKGVVKKQRSVEIFIPEDILSDSDQLTQTDLDKIQDYLSKQPGTRQGQYVITIETSDGMRQIIFSFVIGPEKAPSKTSPTESATENNPDSQTPAQEDQQGDQEGSPNGSREENTEKPSNPNDQSLYLDPRESKKSIALGDTSGQATDQAWSLALGSLWLARKSGDSAGESQVDFSVQARRIRRLLSQSTPSKKNVSNFRTME
jgi:hypothetical protein